MGIVRKQSSWSTVLTYLGIIVGYVNIGYLFPKVLSEEAFGLRSILMEFSVLAGYLASFGTTGAIQKFLYSYSLRGEEKKKEFAFFVLLMLLIGLTITFALIKFNESVIISFYGEKSPLFIDFLYLVYPLIFFISANYFLESFLVSTNNSTISFFGKEIVIRILLSCIIGLLVFDLISVNTFWLLFVANYLILLLFYVAYSIRKKLFSFSFNFLNKKDRKGIVVFSFFSLLGSLAGIVILKIDVLMIAGLSPGGIRDVAVYSMCIIIVSVIESPRRVLSQVVVPFIIKYFEEKDMGNLDAIYKKTSSTLLVIGGGVFLAIWFSIDLLYVFAPKGEFFALGKQVVLLLGIAKIIEMLFGTSAQIISYSDKFKLSLPLIISLALLTIVTNVLLIPTYGIEGAAIATLTCYLIINIARMLLVYYCFKIQPFTIKTLLGVGGIAFFLFFGDFIHFSENLVLNIFIRLTFIGVGYFVFMFIFNISPDINNFVVLQTKKLIKK